MKWIFENWIKLLTVYLGYGFAWYVGWKLSINFETIANITSWFLPAGVRVSSLLLIDKKYWPVIALSEFTVIYAVNSSEHFYTTMLAEEVGTLLPILIYMVVIHLYLKSSKHARLDSVQPVIKLLAWSGLGAILTAASLATSLMLEGQVPQDKLITTISSFLLGDFIGILLLVPFGYTVKTLRMADGLSSDLKRVLTGANITLFSISLIITILLIQQNMVYYIKLFSFILIIIFAYRGGWLGAAISVFMVNVIIIFASYIAADFGDMLEKQLYLIAISMTGLILGAATSEQRSLNLQLGLNNDELLVANKQLLVLINKNQLLAKKVINIQEEERKIISRELHDELGQNITALKLNIHVIKQMVGESTITPILESIDHIANITYQSAYQLMHRLRPPVLDDLGLETALISGAFGQLLKNTGILYVPISAGDLTTLSEEITIAIYRIVQESVNNSAKHSQAKHLWMTLKVDNSNVKLEIKDDGIGFEINNINKLKSSFGLQGIEDRVVALGGLYNLTSDANGTNHTVTFNI